jgi:membrane-bound metal-dependent hydrolase YbcI (DUF457 family)
MSEATDSFYYKAYNPILQAGIVLGAILAVMIGGAFIKSTGLIEVGDRFPWLTAASFMLFFAMFNSIFSLSAKEMNQYWSRSMMSFMGLALASALLAWLFSSISINDAGSYRWIFIVVTIGYLVFMSMMRMMKNIVEFAEREEWNQPRKRK